EDDEDPEEDPADYPADRDNDDDDDEEEEEPFGDDVDDEDEDKNKDEEEEEEHPAPADSVPPVHHMTTRISIRDEPSISLPPREEVERLLALTTPPPSPLTPLSSPLPHIPSPPFPASPPASPIRPLGYQAAMIRLRAETPSTSYPLLLPTSSPLLQLLSSDHRTDRPDITLPPQKRLCIDLGPRYEIGESSAAAATRPIGGRRADYGFVVMGQQAVISQLQAVDRRSQVVTSEMLQADHQRQVQLTKALKLLKGLQTQMVEFQRQHGPAKGPAQPDAPGEAGCSS
ncbi:hypothetical protein Tco_0081401, partial [Tanacetum coccineum]